MQRYSLVEYWADMPGPVIFSHDSELAENTMQLDQRLKETEDTASYIDYQLTALTAVEQVLSLSLF